MKLGHHLLWWHYQIFLITSKFWARAVITCVTDVTKKGHGKNLVNFIWNFSSNYKQVKTGCDIIQRYTYLLIHKKLFISKLIVFSLLSVKMFVTDVTRYWRYEFQTSLWHQIFQHVDNFQRFCHITLKPLAFDYQNIYISIKWSSWSLCNKGLKKR